MKRTEQNLEDMLRLVREHPPARGLFSSSDVRQMIAQERPANGAEPRGKSSFNTIYRPYIIMTFITAIILAGAMILHFGQNDPASQKRIADSHRLHGQEGENDRTVSFPSVLPNSDEQKLPAGRNTAPPPPKTEEKGEKGKEGKKETSDSDMIAGAVLSDFTSDELERLFGIRFTGERTEISAEELMETGELPLETIRMLHDRGYDTTAPHMYVRSRAVVGFAPGSVMGTTEVTAPERNRLLASPTGLTVFEEESNASSLAMTMGGDAQTERIGVWQEQVADEIMELSETEGKIAPGSALSRLIAIRVPGFYQDKNGKEVRREIVVWYVPTPELVAALPARYRTPRVTALAHAVYPQRPPLPRNEEDARLIPGILQYSSRWPTPEDTAAHYYGRELTKPDGQGDIGGIRFLDLTRSEQERIGIRFGNSGISFVMEQQFGRVDKNTAETLEELGYAIDGEPVNVGFEVHADTFAMDYRELTAEEMTATTLKPVLYSGRWTKPEGHEGLSMIFTTASPLLKKLGAGSESLKSEVFDAYDNQTSTAGYQTLNKLIPVRISLESNDYIERAGRNRGGEIVLWYVPTPEFVGALPDRYRIPLEKELKLIASVEEGNIPPGEVCRQMAGENVIMDFCRAGSGAISHTRVWPNPARESLTIHYVLTAPRRVAITLHDLSGRFLGEIADDRMQSAGAHQESITLDRNAVGSGTYLVTVHTDQGEQGIQRVVVE